MAIMWPRKLPPDVLRNKLRSAERETYQRLKSTLDDSYTVFYSRPWLGLSATGEEIDGECDFVVAHARSGLLTIEVKGGAIAYDPEKERWTSKDRWNLTHNIRNPVQQARTSKYRILEKLRHSTDWSPRRIRARYGVIFPNSKRPGRDLGADMPLRIFCFEKEFDSNLGKWIEQRFEDLSDEAGSELPLGPDGLRALERLLAFPFQLKTPLGNTLSRDDDELNLLTQEQFHILSHIEAVPRAAISGAAGTGKTVLAVEEARRCMESGMRCLFTCLSPALALDVAERLNDTGNVTVLDFRNLCSTMAKEAGVALPAGSSERVLDELYPEALMQAWDRLSTQRYDAVIVDEGQDFLPLWWSSIDAALAPHRDARLRIFFDSNQRVYRSIGRLPEDVQVVPIRLTRNLRNTQRIHEFVLTQYEGFPITATGPEGVAVEAIKAPASGTVQPHVDLIVARLAGESIRPEHMAVLVETEADIGHIVRNGRCGGLPITNCSTRKTGALIVDTIRNFKGLESRVVIVVCTSRMLIERELPYVGFSRARTHLILVGEEKALPSLKAAT
jgi:hypothetical protein